MQAVIRVQPGDDLVRLLVPRIAALRHYISRRIPTRFRQLVCPDDILQEVWLAANRTAPNFTGREQDDIDRWLMTIANAKLVDAIRRARASKRGGHARFVCNERWASLSQLFAELESCSPTPSREARAIETAHAVSVSLTRLSEDRRRVIEMRFVDGLMPGQIAARLGKSASAVNSLLYNGLRQLRALLGNASRYLSGSRTIVLPDADRIR